MYSYSLLDEAAVRRLTVPELVERNRGLKIYAQPVKDDAEWSYLIVHQYGRRFALASTAPLDSHHGSDYSGRSVFDTSSPRGRRALTDCVWAYVGLDPDAPESLHRRFADALCRNMPSAQTLLFEPAAIVAWSAGMATKDQQSLDAKLARMGSSVQSKVEIRSYDKVFDGDPLTKDDLQERLEGVVVDYERISALGAPVYKGTVTILQGNRQHRFDSVSWPRYSRSFAPDADAFVRHFSELVGVHKKERRYMEPLFRDRFRRMFPTRQAYYDVHADMDWLYRVREVKRAKQTEWFAKHERLPAPKSPDLVLDTSDFLPEPGSDVAPAPKPHDERGSLPLAMAPGYRVVTFEGALHLRL